GPLVPSGGSAAPEVSVVPRPGKKSDRSIAARSPSEQVAAVTPAARPMLGPAIVAAAVGAAAAYAIVSACGKAGDPPQPATHASASASEHEGAESHVPSTRGLIDPTNGGGNNLVAIPGGDESADAGTYSGPMLGAAHFQTHIFERPDYSSARIGYLRAGAKVPILGGVAGEAVKRIKTPSCKDGWVAIQPRGYICLEKGGGALNLEQPNVRLATAPPNFEDLLPYRYAFNWRQGAPLYRRVPSPKEWTDKEPWLRPAPPKKVHPKTDKSTDKTSDKTGDDDKSASAEPTTATSSSTGTVEATTNPSVTDSGPVAARATDKPDDEPTVDVLDAGAASSDDAALAWWERDAGKGTISLRDTMEGEGLVARRMAKGFAIAIDRSFAWSGRNWHRTTMGLVAPADVVTMIKAPEYKGVELGTDMQLPVAWSLIKEAGIFESKDKKSFAIRDRLKKQTPIRLLPSTAPGYEEIKTGGFTYLPTFDGRYVRAGDLAKADVATPPKDLKPGEKWIDVSIKTQTLVAYEGDKPVYATLVSTGKDGTNTKGQFATVQGSYRIREKHVAATMDGDTAGELYSIDDVPYIQYFHDSYALHGAFWHAAYGTVRSHGCVNLSPADAKRLFFWTEPQLPTGWHAVWSTESNPGTRIVTHP
ncbi:MAG: L,D-transpeptidase, partial [Polyangiales bacterium]